MPCEKCGVRPGYHSFVRFGSLKEVNLFYTAPAKTEDLNEDGTKLENIKIHIAEDTKGKPWIWVLDCAQMQFHHYTDIQFSTGLLQILATDARLLAVWIVRPNFWIRSTVGILKTFSSAAVLNNITYFEGSKTGIITALEYVGLDSAAARWLVRQDL